MIWDKYPFFVVLGGILVSFSGSTWFGGNGDAEFGKLPKHHLLFSSIGKVIEIPDGSMERFTDLLQQNEITVVLFYAPWCGQSSAAAREFNRAAEILHKQVSFIAINCWVGTCSKQQRVDQFPKVVAIHSQFDVVEYKGSFKTSKMIAFLQSVLRPFIYIGTDVELYQAKQSNQEVVISYFNQPMRSNKNYTAFFTLALQFKAKDSSPMFAVVTSAKLALKAGVDGVTGVTYHRLNHALLSYPSSNSFTSQNLTRWIDANRFQLVVQLTLSLDKRGHFVSHLSKGPALILFLPLHLSEESQQLLVQYLSTASQYFNCSCTRTTDTRNITSQNLQDIDRDNTAKALKNFDFKEQTLNALQSIITQGDLMITGKEWHLPMLQTHKRKCQSLQIPGQSNLEKKHNVCDVCYTCDRQNCHHNMVPGLQSLITLLLSLRDSCSCFRSGYDLFAAASICCTVQTVETKNLSSSEQKTPSYLESLRQVRTSLDGFLGDVLAAITPPVSKPALQKGVNEVISLNVKNSPQKGLSVKDYFDPSPMIFGDETNKNSCTATNQVVQFHGAGCHSNRSVNFFIMDSTEYWHVAEKLGVHNTPIGKTALVIADSENDAQFVLDEKMQITNTSIVGFVMAYMTGNLSRRFRSNSARPGNECLLSQACVVEVVTSTFRELVLDETKDVLLLYYASWCAFCQSLAPVLLTVAKFFQNIADVIIARINADDNDLPWELVVSRYPSLIFFPAYRKDLSIRFPDSLERTAANIVEFVLDHGVKAGNILQEFHLSAILKEKLHKLEMLLYQVEEEKGIIEMTLRESFGAKELWRKTSDIAYQETMRMQGEDLNKVLDQRQHQLKEKTMKLLKGSADVLKQLTTSRKKLNCNEKLLGQVMFNNRRFVFNSEQLYVRLWRTVMALQEQKKVVLELQESVKAIRRRATQLDISNSILSTKLKNLRVS